MAKTLPLSDGTSVIVDDDVWDWAKDISWQFRKDKPTDRGVVRRSVCHRGQTTLLHRLILGRGRGAFVGYKNGDPRDCQRENLVPEDPINKGIRDRHARRVYHLDENGVGWCLVCRSFQLFSETTHSSHGRPIALLKCRSCKLTFVKGTASKRRDLIFQHYGQRCDCCGETTYEFLHLDHVRGGGNKHRAATGERGGYHVYKAVIRDGFPDIYRILCANCNLSFGFYGYCPHEKNKAAADIAAARCILR